MAMQAKCYFLPLSVGFLNVSSKTSVSVLACGCVSGLKKKKVKPCSGKTPICVRKQWLFPSRFAYKDEYEKFKLYLTIILLLGAVACRFILHYR